MEFVLKVALRDKDVKLLDELVAEANEAAQRDGGPQVHDRERMLATIGLNGLVDEAQRRRIGQVKRQELSVSEVGYGRTYNLGNYESERLDVRVAVEPGETPEQAMERAQAWIEQQHRREAQIRGYAEYVETLERRAQLASSNLDIINSRIEQGLKQYSEIRDRLAAEGRQLPDPSTFGRGLIRAPEQPPTDLINPQAQAADEAPAKAKDDEDLPF